MKANICDRCNEFYKPYSMHNIEKMRNKQHLTKVPREYKIYRENEGVQTLAHKYDWSPIDLCPKCYYHFLLWMGHDLKEKIDEIEGQESFGNIEEYNNYIQKYKGG